jgi:hypothetical protein
MPLILTDETTGLNNIFADFDAAVAALKAKQVTMNGDLAIAAPPAAIALAAGAIKCAVVGTPANPSDALGRIGNTIKSLTAHIVELTAAFPAGDAPTSVQLVANFNLMKNKCFNVKDVVTGGSRRGRQSKKRKNQRNHNNNQ